MLPESIPHVCHHGETLSDCHRSWVKRLKKIGLKNTDQQQNNSLLLKSEGDLQPNEDPKSLLNKCHSTTKSYSKVSSSLSSSQNSHKNLSQNVSHFLVLVLTLLTFANCAGKNYNFFTFFLEKFTV